MRPVAETRKQKRLQERYAKELFDLHFSYCNQVKDLTYQPEIDRIYDLHNLEWTQLVNKVNRVSIFVKLNIDGFKNMVENKSATRRAMGKKTLFEKFKGLFK